MTSADATTISDERIVDAAVGALELLAIHLGRRLGLYHHLTAPRTVGELADVAEIHPRYAREWLEQQAVAGLISTDPSVERWDDRPYWIDEQQTAILVTADDPAHVSPVADMIVGVATALDQVTDAYRTGGGVPFDQYGPHLRGGQANINRPAFLNDLGTAWIEAAPDVAERLRHGGTIVDLGCGGGWSTIGLAEAFPAATVVGIDSDRASIVDAQANAKGAGSRARFELADASDRSSRSDVDLVVVLEALHDMARPVEALRSARAMLADDGVVLVADEKVQPAFTAPGDDLERMMYGWSVVHCLPAAMAEEPSAAIGTVIRPALVESLATEAGFASVELSTIDAGFFNLYVLRR